MQDNVKLGRYADVLLRDRWFKRSFGTEQGKRLLQLFLELVIPERKIASLTLVQEEHVNPDEERKDIRVDVACTDTDGSRFVVEIQRAWQEGFYERAVFNSSFAVQQQISIGETTYLFPTVYFIGIMNFSYHKDSNQVLFRYNLQEVESHELMTERLQYIFLELPNSRGPRGQTLLEWFAYSLRNISSLDAVPEEIQGEEIIQLLFKSAELSTFTADERKRYTFDMTTERDLKNQMDYALKQAREEGLEQGRAQGKVEGKVEGKAEGESEGKAAMAVSIARNLLQMGMSRADVARATELSEEVVAQLC